MREYAREYVRERVREGGREYAREGVREGGRPQGVQGGGLTGGSEAGREGVLGTRTSYTEAYRACNDAISTLRTQCINGHSGTVLHH